MSAQVGRKQCIASLHEGRGYVGVPSAMLAQPMNQTDYPFAGGARLFRLWLPESGIDSYSICRVPFQFLRVQW